jgi:hypothetical protein
MAVNDKRPGAVMAGWIAVSAPIAVAVCSWLVMAFYLGPVDILQRSQVPFPVLRIPNDHLVIWMCGAVVTLYVLVVIAEFLVAPSDEDLSKFYRQVLATARWVLLALGPVAVAYIAGRTWCRPTLAWSLTIGVTVAALVVVTTRSMRAQWERLGKARSILAALALLALVLVVRWAGRPGAVLNLDGVELSAAPPQWDENLNSPPVREIDLAYAAPRTLRANGAKLVGVKIEHLDLESAQLEGADLRHAKLAGLSAREVNLARAYLQWADLTGANLPQAKLAAANLQHAKLDWAELGGAELNAADLAHATLKGADLCNAKIGGAQHIDAACGDTSTKAGVEIRCCSVKNDVSFGDDEEPAPCNQGCASAQSPQSTVHLD